MPIDVVWAGNEARLHASGEEPRGVVLGKLVNEQAIVNNKVDDLVTQD
jgi:hypothetical protein